jgi:hypothetical protein
MQCCIVKGIVKKWKQVVFADFDTAMTKALLFDIIDNVEKSGVKICIIISDMGPSNLSLWKELDVTMDKPFFMYLDSSGNSRQVFVIPDIPHLLKLLRNHILDDGLKLPGGTIIDKQSFSDLIDRITSSELTIAPQLRHRLITVSRNERQRVLPAAQLLSNKTAAAMKRVFGEKMKEPAEFIELVNCWFDCCNSRRKFDENPMKCAFGIHLPEQEGILREMIEIMMNSRQLETCTRKQQMVHSNNEDILEKNKYKVESQSLKPYQKGIIMVSNVILELFSVLRNEYGIQYLLTSNINQDSVENLFSRIRGLCAAYDHPSPLSAMHRLRLLCLGKNTEFAVKSAPVATNENTDVPTQEEEIDLELSQSCEQDEVEEMFTLEKKRVDIDEDEEQNIEPPFITATLAESVH